MRLIASRIALAVFVVLFVLVHPLCNCPEYFLKVGTLALIPLACGPKRYRLFAAVALAATLVAAGCEQNNARQMRDQIERTQQESREQQLRELNQKAKVEPEKKE